MSGTVRSTSVGAEVWHDQSGVVPVRVTSVGTEVWFDHVSITPVAVTLVGTEMWFDHKGLWRRSKVRRGSFVTDDRPP